MAVPNVSYKVEIAFNAGYRTPAASRVWTDVSAYAELHEGSGISYGRQDEVSVADANQYTITLDNKDGRFTFGNAASPYYPNVKLNRPIRLTATIGGGDSVRFTGYINEWPVEWPGGAENYASTKVAASSRLSRLGLDSPLAVAVDQAIEVTEPTYYWTLADPAGSTQGAESRGGPSLAASGQTVAFGVGAEDESAETLGVDSRGAVKLTGLVAGEAGGTLVVDLPTPVPIGASSLLGASVGFYVKTLNPDAFGTWTTQAIVSLTDATGASGIAFGLVGASVASGAGAANANYAIDLSNDGSEHHVGASVVGDGANFDLSVYLDGVLSATATVAASSVSMTRLRLSWPTSLLDGFRDLLIGRIGVWSRELTPAEWAAVAGAGIGAYSGDTTDQRLARYAEWARIPPTELVTTASPVTIAGTSAEGAQVVSLMREVEATEAGVLYDNRDGNLVLKPRSARYGTTVALQVDFDDHKIGVDYSPKVDRQGLANVGKGTNTLGTSEATYTDEASRDEHGDASYEVQTAALDPDEPLQLVAWQVKANADPRPRAPSVTLKVLDWIGHVDLPAILALDIGSKVRLVNSPTQAPTSTVDYFVEGYTETFGVSEWSIALNLSPVAPYDSVFILEDPVYGVLDTYTVLAL